MPQIRITNPGPHTTIQDLGRPAYQSFGMPEAGAMDRWSLTLANYLAGNSCAQACLECTFVGPEFEVLSPAQMAFAGGELSATNNDNPLSPLVPHTLKPGDQVKFGFITKGCRTYIAFAGGILVPKIMGSRSTYLRAEIGGFKGRKLQRDDTLRLGHGENTQTCRQLIESDLLSLQVNNTLRVIAGTEVEAFTFEGLQNFLTSVYTISHHSDRMGIQLDGAPITHKSSPDIVSAGISNGAIQVPGNGKPILLLADRQTTGGYTKIANVISADLPLVGQMRPGDQVRFEHVHLDVAHDLLREQNEKLRRIIRRFARS